MTYSNAGAADDLRGRRVLVVEDEMLVAMLIEDVLADLGCVLVGPIARVAQALDCIRNEALDCAFLDVNVAGESIYPVADALAGRGVPFAFLTGYGAQILPESYRSRPVLQKPFALEDLEAILRRCLGQSGRG